ncbi:hypothetical protein ABC977_05145 [Thioalkalicoccus limnaeus]|uniref:Terminase n=1 Tax=Thioalkalicoccus limnaeus TaxID=120681 RepID=A0ABV4BBD6_9GAMM
MRADLHSLVPPLGRWDLDERLLRIARQDYFLRHAPRQTGKATCLLALMGYLNRGGRSRAVSVYPTSTARKSPAKVSAAT